MFIWEHGLYGGAIFLKTNPKLYWWGVLSGMMPDLSSFTFITSKVGVNRTIHLIKGADEGLPKSVYKIYYITHSFVTAVALSIFLYIIHKDLVILAFPYSLHILFDIPFHEGHFSTRPFYPFSNFHLNGYYYANHKRFWIVNYIIIFGLYFYLLLS